MTEPRWYAACTRSRHEKSVAEQCAQRSITNFVPLYECARNWKNGRHRVRLPLFPGYAFVRIVLSDRLVVLKIPGVVRLVGFNGVAAPLADSEVERLQQVLASGVQATPHPFLRVGHRVRVKSGPLAGLEGHVVRRGSNCRLVLSLDLIQRSIAASVDVRDVDPMAT
jgi:transcription antitermination factor NusG